MDIRNCEIIKFPAGEVQVRVPEFAPRAIFARVDSSDNLIATYQALSILRQRSNENIDLLIPYLPYSRQDKAHVSTECASLNYILKLLRLDDCGSVKIHTLDQHNPAPLRGVINYGIEEWFPFGKLRGDDFCVVWPDKSAKGRADKFRRLLSRVFEYQEIEFNKERDPVTGQIRGIVPMGEIPQCDYYVVIDDICDGGGTFIPIAEQLPEGSSKILATSHAMYSRGVELLGNHFDQLWTTNSYKEHIGSTDIFTVFAEILNINAAIGINI